MANRPDYWAKTALQPKPQIITPKQPTPKRK